jgi:hypothetical protein
MNAAAMNALAADLYGRATSLARQRQQIMAAANNPTVREHAPTTRRTMLASARKVEKIIVGIAEMAERAGAA